MTEPTTITADLSTLLRAMPTLSTPAAERADWFDRKAALLDRIAATDPTAVELAQAARDQASQLRAGWSA